MNLVIDADIAKSSGLTVHPVSSSSRSLLDKVISGNHNIYFCITLLAEWNKHQSSYTKRWRASMYAKKKVVLVSHNDLIKTALQALPQSKSQKAAVKDSHLVDIANLSGKTILSNDITARSAISTLLSGSALISGVYWISPLSDRNDIDVYVLSNKIIPKKHLL